MLAAQIDATMKTTKKQRVVSAPPINPGGLNGVLEAATGTIRLLVAMANVDTKAAMKIGAQIGCTCAHHVSTGGRPGKAMR